MTPPPSAAYYDTERYHSVSSIRSPQIQPYEVQHSDACGLAAAIKEGAPSHIFLQQALAGCSRLDHRGGVLPLEGSGDGIGIATSMPHDWLRERLSRLCPQPGEGPHACGLVFFSGALRPMAREHLLTSMRRLAQRQHIALLAWEPAPFEISHLGEQARRHAPLPYYLYFAPTAHPSEYAFEHDVYLLQQAIERWTELKIAEEQLPAEALRLVSLSPYSLVHKGMGSAEDLRRTWPALSDARYRVAWYALHRRFSTNTAPQWWLAQPFSLLAHNGEINTIRKNRRTARHLEKGLQVVRRLAKVLTLGGSDTADMDRVLQQRYFALRNFYDPPTALLTAFETVIPPAYNSRFCELGPQIRDFLRFHRRHLGGGAFFGGPAFCIAFTRGTLVGKVDNMALRPAKWLLQDWLNSETLRHERVFSLGSEFGALHSPGLENLVDGGLLGPGDIVMAHRQADGTLQWAGTSACHRQILEQTDSRIAYHAQRAMAPQLDSLSDARAPQPDSALDLERARILAGWHAEQLEHLQYMAAYGTLKVQAMGTPWPMPALWESPCSVFAAAQQRFAQVTNPPLDALREGDKFDLNLCLGGRVYDTKIYSYTPIEQIRLPSPLMDNRAIARLLQQRNLRTVRIACGIRQLDEGEQAAAEALRARLDALGSEVLRAAHDGVRIIILSHRLVRGKPEELPLESPLALGAGLRALNQSGTRQFVSLVLEADDVKEAHDVALLLALGASAVNPALAEDSVCRGVGYKPGFVQQRAQLFPGREQQVGVRLNARQRERHTVHQDGPTATRQVYAALEGGLKKIMSKMGINAIDGYRASGLFELLGIGPELAPWLGGLVPSRIGGPGLAARAQHLQARRARATEGPLPALHKLPHAWKKRSLEVRGQNVSSLIIRPLRELCASDAWSGIDIFAAGFSWQAVPLPSLQLLWKTFAGLRPVGFGSARFQLRDLLRVRDLPLADLQAAELQPSDLQRALQEFLPRIRAGHMSFGALLRWAKEAIELAMHSLGSFGGSGEGGIPAQVIQGARPRAAQVASGRFGVTAAYLAHPEVEEICIKISQGAKPGEGGQLPGHKVNVEIAGNRFCEAGTELISPPPHHDIYSIEELTQLIEDLRSVHPAARIAVKLVAGTNIGTIAAGVVKAGAQVIEIDGYEGGTGARCYESHHAGLPTELGLREVHQTLCRLGLRDLVRLRALGGIKCAGDVLCYLLLGADEVGCGTLAMVGLNCNLQANCNVGCGIQIAHPLLSAQKTFSELSEQLGDAKAYRAFVEARAKQVALLFLSIGLELAVTARLLGVEQAADLCGRVGWLRPAPDVPFALDRFLQMEPAEQALIESCGLRTERRRSRSLAAALEKRQEARLCTAYLSGAAWPDKVLQLRSSSDRSFGARLSGLRLRAGRVEPVLLRTAGHAGNSYAVWASAGMRFEHTGSAEEGFAKGISHGASVVLRRPEPLRSSSLARIPLVSNNVAFGATGGRVFVDSLTGQRCGIRLSGDTLLFARGGGKYAAEYMTGGSLLLLPLPALAGAYPVVRGSFGAGMSGGEAFVYVLHGQKIEEHLDAGLTVRELNDDNPADRARFATHLLSFVELGLDPQEAELWRTSQTNRRGRVVCIRPRASQPGSNA